MEVVKGEMESLEEIYETLKVCDILYLAINGEEFPQIYSMLYGVEIDEDGDTINIYFYDDKDDEKADVMMQDPKVSIQTEIVYEYYEYPHTSISCSYASVTGYGLAKIDNEEFDHAMDLILTHYGFEGFDYDVALKETKNVYKITLQKVKGKRHLKTPA